VQLIALNGIQENSKTYYLYKKYVMQPIFIKVYGTEKNYYVNIAHIALLEENPGENDKMYLNINDSEGLPVIIELEHNMESIMEDIEEEKKSAMNLLHEDQSHKE